MSRADMLRTALFYLSIAVAAGAIESALGMRGWRQGAALLVAYTAGWLVNMDPPWLRADREREATD